MEASRAPLAGLRRDRSSRGSPAWLLGVWPSLIAGATALGVVVTLAFQSGGYFPSDHLGAGAVAFAVLAVLLVARPLAQGFSSQALVALGSLAALTVWAGLSTRWSLSPDAGLQDMQLDLVYVGLFGLALMAAATRRLAPVLVWGVLFAAAVVVIAGLLSRLYPDIVDSGVPLDPGGFRLAWPLQYWNAFGAFASFGAVLGLGIAADPRSPVAVRGLSAAAAVAMSVAMYLSFSRGAWLAMGVGLVVLAGLSAHRATLLITVGIVVPVVILAISRLGVYPALTKDPAAGAGQLAAGRAFGPELLAYVALAAVGQGLAAAGGTSREVIKLLRRFFRPLMAGAAVGVVVLGVLAYSVKTSSVEGHSARVSTRASDWIDRQWKDFLRPANIAGTSNTARLTSSKGTRSDLYRVAIDQFEGAPLKGQGAGSFEARFTHSRRVDESVVNAHSLYFEVLGGLGLVGATLLLVLIGSIAAAAVRSRLRPGGLGRSQVAAAGAGVAVWVFHAGVDWDWQMPALTGAALVLAATVFPQGRRRARRRATEGQEPLSP